MPQERRLYHGGTDRPTPQREADETLDSLIGRVEGWDQHLIGMNERAARILGELRAALGGALVDDDGNDAMRAGLFDRVGARLMNLAATLSEIEDLVGERDA